MQPFSYEKVTSEHEAIERARLGNATFVAGGTTLLDLMKLNVEVPTTLVDINALPLNQIEDQSDGSIRIGALVRNGDLAHDARIQARYRGAFSGDPRRRLGAAAKHGDNGRQPDAAHALLLLSRPGIPMQ